jgi:hypothetical protein
MWLCSSQGMQGLSGIGAAMLNYTDPKDVGAAVSSGFESRFASTLTLTVTEKYQVDQATIASGTITIKTDTGAPDLVINFNAP